MASSNGIVSGAPGYRLEGAGDESSAEPQEGEEVINEIFDLADNDFVFYQNSFVGKRKRGGGRRAGIEIYGLF